MNRRRDARAARARARARPARRAAVLGRRARPPRRAQDAQARLVADTPESAARAVVTDVRSSSPTTRRPASRPALEPPAPLAPPLRPTPSPRPHRPGGDAVRSPMSDAAAARAPATCARSRASISVGRGRPSPRAEARPGASALGGKSLARISSAWPSAPLPPRANARPSLGLVAREYEEAARPQLHEAAHRRPRPRSPTTGRRRRRRRFLGPPRAVRHGDDRCLPSRPAARRRAVEPRPATALAEALAARVAVAARRGRSPSTEASPSPVAPRVAPRAPASPSPEASPRRCVKASPSPVARRRRGRGVPRREASPSRRPGRPSSRCRRPNASPAACARSAAGAAAPSTRLLRRQDDHRARRPTDQRRQLSGTRRFSGEARGRAAAPGEAGAVGPRSRGLTPYRSSSLADGEDDVSRSSARLRRVSAASVLRARQARTRGAPARPPPAYSSRPPTHYPRPSS